MFDDSAFDDFSGIAASMEENRARQAANQSLVHGFFKLLPLSPPIHR
jgi:hypothetical protein